MAAPKKKNPGMLVCYGNDGYWVETTAREHIDALIPEANRVFGLDTYDGLVESGSAAAEVVRRCAAALDTPPFLGGPKVVWLKGASFLGASGRAARGQGLKEGLERLTELLRKGLPPGVHFLVTSAALDKRSAFYKACEKAGEVREFTIAEKGYEIDQQAGEIIRAALKDAGLTAVEEVVVALAEREGCDTRQIRNEVEKLRLYMGDRKTVELEDVEAVVCPVRGCQPWDLADAVLQRNLPKALRLLNRLLFQKTAGVYLMAVLEGRFKEFLVYREALDRGWLRGGGGYGRQPAWELPDAAAASLTAILGKDPRTLPAFIVNQRVRQVQGYRKGEILRIQRRLLETHRQLVTGAADERWLLETMLIRLLRPVRVA